MNPSSHSHYSVVLELPARQVWAVVRDFNSYPIWVDGVDESHIEEDLSGTTVGGVRNFAMGGFRTRQRLLAHSDVDRFFTYVVTQSRSKQMALLELLSTTRAP